MATTLVLDLLPPEFCLLKGRENKPLTLKNKNEVPIKYIAPPFSGWTGEQVKNSLNGLDSVFKQTSFSIYLDTQFIGFNVVKVQLIKDGIR